METGYALYYTLNKNLGKIKMTKAQGLDLQKKLDELADESARKAVVMLIAEHSKVVDQTNFDTADIVIPYKGIQDEDGTRFDLKDFPQDLKWILWKFSNLETESNNPPKTTKANVKSAKRK